MKVWNPGVIVSNVDGPEHDATPMPASVHEKLDGLFVAVWSKAVLAAGAADGDHRRAAVDEEERRVAARRSLGRRGVRAVTGHRNGSRVQHGRSAVDRQGRGARGRWRTVHGDDDVRAAVEPAVQRRRSAVTTSTPPVAVGGGVSW